MFQLKTMLIVVDDPELAHVLVEACRRIGLYPQTAQNVVTATARIYRRKPDILCVNAEMPFGAGLELCQMLASTIQGQKVPVIVLTDRRYPDTILRCGPLCAYYVRKSGDVWNRILPLIYELVDIDPIANHVLFGWDEAS